MPTGTTPRASATSWLLHPTAATRSGLLGIVVSPRACVIVIGNVSSAAAEPVEAGELDEAQPVNRSAAAAARAAVVRMRGTGIPPLLWGWRPLFK